MIDQNVIDYFIAETNKRIDKLEDKSDERFDKVDRKLDLLFEFRWRLAGATGLLSLVLVALAEAFVHAVMH